MAAGTVRLRGYRETMRALNRVDKSTRKVILEELRQVGENPIASEFRSKVGQYAGASTGTIGVNATARGVYVRQRARKVTGLRGDFGSLQMRYLLGIVATHEDTIGKQVEDAFDRLVRGHGF